jgi:NAD(P)-dependent dehydrogenase (short-subunit alcohol dehydrogenase family)
MLTGAGGKVVIADLNDAAGWSGAPAASARYIRADVTDEAQVQAAVDLCTSAFGAIHGAINCAGVAPASAWSARPGRTRSRASSAPCASTSSAPST